MKNVLITGGAGFIGFHLAKKILAQNIPVTIADNFSRAVEDADFEQLKNNKLLTVKNVDFLKADELATLGNEYSHIFHLAAIIGVQHVLKRPYDVLNLNTLMLSNAIELARKQIALARFVFTSTSEIYAGTLANYGLKFPTDEMTPLSITQLSEPRTSYMLSKIYGEAMCLHSGLPVTIVRPHNFYGPRMGLSHVVPELLQKAHRAIDGEVLDVFSVSHQRTFCYIEDAVHYIAELATENAALGESFNIGVESPEISIGDLAHVVLKVTSKKLQINPGAETSGSPSRRCPSLKKMHQVVSYRSRFSLEEGLIQTYQWYKQNVFEGGISAL